MVSGCDSGGLGGVVASGRDSGGLGGIAGSGHGSGGLRGTAGSGRGSSRAGGRIEGFGHVSAFVSRVARLFDGILGSNSCNAFLFLY